MSSAVVQRRIPSRWCTDSDDEIGGYVLGVDGRVDVGGMCAGRGEGGAVLANVTWQ